MFFCLCAGTTLDLNQTKPQLSIKNVKLFAHTEKNYYLCTRKQETSAGLQPTYLISIVRGALHVAMSIRKKEGKLPETFLNDIKNKNCLG